MPTSRPKTEASPSEAGFTLVELLVVIVIVGLLGSVAASRLSGARGFAARPRLAAAASRVLADAREQAMATGNVVAVTAGALGKAGDDVAVNGSDGSGAVRFYADGSSSGGTVAMRATPLLTVDWLTGEVDNSPSGARDAHR